MKKLIICFACITISFIAGCDKPQESADITVLSPKSPGTITIVKATGKNESNHDKFRTFDIRGESIIQYAPEGQEITQAVKNVQVNVAVRNTPYASIHARLLQQRLSKEFIVFCSACHDDYANGVIGPSLIGKNKKEVLEMMEKYHNEKDANVLMTSLVERMTEQEKQFIAQDLARFNAEVHSNNKPALESKYDGGTK